MKNNPDSGHVVSTREKLACLYQFFATWESDRPADYESVLKFIRRLLRQYRLSHLQEADILHEAYRRAVHAIKEGKEIDTLPGWMRSTALNIVREIRKKEARQEKLVEKLGYFDSSTGNSPVIREDAFVNPKWGRLIDLIDELDEESQAILRMKEIDNLSWREIKENLGSSSNESTLRKRYQRLKERIKEIF